jgi:catechol 2,3-dioxygenase-like lactoylglutathione lyase family enzyme
MTGDDIPPSGLDHIVLATPQLDTTVAEFTRRTGVRPAPGGSHPGLGTRNHLVGLGGDRYLEIIGPDPEQPVPARPRPFGIDRLTGPVVATWVLRTSDLEAAVARSRLRGYDPGAVRGMSRQRPDGGVLQWRLTDPAAAHPSGLVPFLIDWQDGAHPARAAPGGLALTGFAIETPQPVVIGRLLAALDVATVPRPGPRQLRFALSTPRGPVTFG